MSEHAADDVTNEPTGAVPGPSGPVTTNADDIKNEPTGAVQGRTEPTTHTSEAAPEAEASKESKTVDTPKATEPRTQTQAETK